LSMYQHAYSPLHKTVEANTTSRGGTRMGADYGKML